MTESSDRQIQQVDQPSLAAQVRELRRAHENGPTFTHPWTTRPYRDVVAQFDLPAEVFAVTQCWDT